MCVHFVIILCVTYILQVVSPWLRTFVVHIAGNFRRCKIFVSLQVAALAPLALLLVLEARCAHFVIAHFNYWVLWSSASLAPTQHIYKLVSEIIVIAMGVVPMSKVEGSWICYQV